MTKKPSTATSFEESSATLHIRDVLLNEAESHLSRAGLFSCATAISELRDLYAALAARPSVDVEAVERVRNYVKQRSGRRGFDPDEVHALDVGCATEAILTLTDLRALLAARTVAPSLDVEKIADEIVVALRKWDESRGYDINRSSRRQVIAAELKRQLLEKSDD